MHLSLNKDKAKDSNEMTPQQKKMKTQATPSMERACMSKTQNSREEQQSWLYSPGI